MDRQSLTQWGSIICIVIILSILIAFATPFGEFVVTSAKNSVKWIGVLTGIGSVDDTQPLKAPENAKVIGNTLTFDSSTGATGYIVTVAVKPQIETDSTTVDLSDAFADLGGTVKISVVATNGAKKSGKISVSYLIPGLYETGSNYTVLLKPWNEVATIGEYNGGVAQGRTGCWPKSTSLAGDLAISNEVTIIPGAAFADCDALTGVLVPNSVLSIFDGAFRRCDKLEHVMFEKNSQLKYVGETAFYECLGLLSVTIPEYVGHLGARAFYECTNLTEINFNAANILLENFEKDNNEIFYNAGINNSGITVTFGPSVEKIPDALFFPCDYYTTKATPNIKKVVFSENSACHTIGKKAFACSSIENLIIPTSVTNIMDSAFSGSSCDKIFYAGTADQWSQINLMNGDSNPGCGGSSEIYFNWELATNITLSNAVTTIKKYAFAYNSNLKSVTIPNSVTQIGDNAFAACQNLETAYYKGSVDQWCQIDFGNGDANPCSNEALLYINDTLVTEISIPNTITSVKDFVFYNCLTLKKVTIPNGVTDIGDYAFYGCATVADISIPNSVTNIGDYAFSGCASITNVTIPSKVTNVGMFSFSDCRSLDLVTLENCATVYNENAFSGCPLSDGINVSHSGGAGERTYTLLDSSQHTVTANCLNCDKILINETAPHNFNGTDTCQDCNYTKVSYAAGLYETGTNYGKLLMTWDELITSGIIDSTGAIVYGQEAALAGDLVISDTLSELPAYAYSCCTSLTGIKLPPSITTIGDYALESCEGLTSVTIPNTVTTIKEGAFYGCYSLGKVIISEGITAVGDRMFYACTGLTSIGIIGSGASVELPNSLTTIGSLAFMDCSNITDVVLPNGLTTMRSQAFYRCSSLKNIDIPNSVVTIGSSAFAECVELVSVVLPDSVTYVNDGIFKKCTKLSSVEFGENVEYIGSSVFEGCSSLTSIRIPEKVYGIGNRAFYNCTGLTEIDFRATSMNDVTTKNYIFAYVGQNTNGTTLTIGANVTKIPAYLFCPYNGNPTSTGKAVATNITTIIFEANSLCTKIQTYAFCNCRSLTSIVYNGTVSQWQSISLGSSWNSSTGTYTISCTDGTIDKTGTVTPLS